MSFPSLYWGASDMRFSTLRNIGSGGEYSRAGIRYPSPFFDVGHTYLPPNLKALLKWCRYYFYTFGIINSAVTKMAAYPITDLHYDTDSGGLHQLWDDLLMRKLGLRSFLFAIGLDYFTYGNAFVGIYFPFIKHLLCPHCNHSEDIQFVKYKFRDFKYEGSCTKCGKDVTFTVVDRYVRAVSKVRLMRWNPEDMDIEYNPHNGEKRILYNLPIQLKNDVVLGKRHVIEHIPDIYVQAIKNNKALHLTKVYHFCRQSISQDVRNMGWGISMMIPVLKDTYYLQMLRKAQEQIAQEHIVPLRILFPQPGSGTSDPYCVAPWGLVETSLGLKHAEEVVAGDLLKSHKGLWRRVEAAVRRSVRCDEKVYSIQVKSLPAFPVEVSEEHPILAAKGNGRGFEDVPEPGWVDAKDLREGDFVCYPTHREVSSAEHIDLACTGLQCTEDHVYWQMSLGAAKAFEYIEKRSGTPCPWGERKEALQEIGCTEEDYNTARVCFHDQWGTKRVPRKLPINEDLATLLGYYAAEGSLLQNRCGVSFGFHKNEMGYCDELDAAIHRLFGFGPGSRYVQGESNGLNYVIHSKLIAHLVSALSGEKFDGKEIPECISAAPEPVLRAYLKALFQGDGCYFECVSGNVRVSLKLANLPMIAKARELLLSLKFLGGIIEEKHTADSISKHTSYSLNYNGNEGIRLARYFGWLSTTLEESPYRTNRSGFFRDGYVFLRVAKIQEIHCDEVIGFQMEGDRSFCVFGVATHNSTVALQDWMGKVRNELEQWKLDPNRIMFAPIPLGNQTMGGDGRALMVAQEMRLLEEVIISGMSVPIEFVKGGLSYGGTALSMHILKNQFETYRRFVLEMIQDFIIENLARYLGWERIKVRLKRFHMADDLQRASLSFQLNQAAKISDKTMLAELDYDVMEETEIIKHESSRQLTNMATQQEAQAHMQGRAQKIQQRYQMSAQQEMQQQATPPEFSQQPPAPTELAQQMPPPQPPQVDIEVVAKQIASQLVRMDESSMYANLRALQPQPELHSRVMRYLNEERGRPNSAAKPLPLQKPPRRGPGQAVI